MATKIDQNGENYCIGRSVLQKVANIVVLYSIWRIFSCLFKFKINIKYILQQAPANEVIQVDYFGVFW